jgi:hypothetical protein
VTAGEVRRGEMNRGARPPAITRCVKFKPSPTKALSANFLGGSCLFYASNEPQPRGSFHFRLGSEAAIGGTGRLSEHTPILKILA